MLKPLCSPPCDEKIKAVKPSSKTTLICAVAFHLMITSLAVGQQSSPQSSKAATAVHVAKAEQDESAANSQLTMDGQNAGSSLLRLAYELKSEPDKPAAALLQAQIADVLWSSDEQAARSIFQMAFDSVSQPIESSRVAESEAVRNAWVRRQASAIREILRRLGAHDQKGAEALRKRLEHERSSQSRPSDTPSPERAELMAHVALELAGSNPVEAQKLGLSALSCGKIPSATGSLLFALSRKDKSLSDALFRATTAALRRNGFDYHPVIISLTNYIFDWSGRPRSDASMADIQFLIDFFIETANAKTISWRQANLAGQRAVSDSDTNLLGFLSSRAAPLVQLNAPEKLRSIEQLMGEMLSNLNQQQQQKLEALQSVQQQSADVLGGMETSYESQLERAEKEREPVVRDTLLRSLALSLMMNNAPRALLVAAKISSPETRAQTEDEINLYVLSDQLKSEAPDDIRRAALKLNDKILQARVITELATRTLSEKDMTRTYELLSEAHSIILKADDLPEKITLLLTIAEHFAKFNSSRGIEVLSDALKALNQVKPDVAETRASLKKPPLTIKIITSFNGKELSPGERATLESINFSPASAFAKQDYLGTRAFGERINDKIMRAKFLVAVDSNVLERSRRMSSIRKTQSRQ